MPTMRAALSEVWNDLTQWTNGSGVGVTLTPNSTDHDVAVANITTTTNGKLTSIASFSVSSGIDRCYLDANNTVAKDANDAVAGVDIHLSVQDGNGCGIMARIERLGGYGGSTTLFGFDYVQGGTHGARGGSAYDATTARYVCVAVDYTNSLLKVQTAADGADLSLDVSWTTLDSFAFSAIAPTFDPTSYQIVLDIIGGSSATTAHVGRLNTTGTGGGGGGGGSPPADAAVRRYYYNRIRE